MAHRPLQWGVEVLISEAELHQPSSLAPQDFFQELAASSHRVVGLALPPGEFVRPGTSSVELRGDGREVYLALRHGGFSCRDTLCSRGKLRLPRYQRAFTLIGNVLSC